MNRGYILIGSKQTESHTCRITEYNYPTSFVINQKEIFEQNVLTNLVSHSVTNLQRISSLSQYFPIKMWQPRHQLSSNHVLIIT